MISGFVQDIKNTINSDQVNDTKLIIHDSLVISQCRFDIYVAKNNYITIPFQFPPIILSESKSGDWEKITTMAYESAAIYKGSSPRSIKMEWEYVVDSSRWDVSRVAAICRAIKSYYYLARAVNQFNSYPVIYIKHTQIIPVTALFRMMDVNITYSDTLASTASTPGGSRGTKFFPLHTKISAGLELATTIQDPTVEKEKPLMNAEPLKSDGNLRVEWF